MTLRSNKVYSQRSAQIIDSSFSTSADLKFYSGTMPTSGTLELTGSDPKEFNQSFYSGQLILESLNWSFKVDDDVLIFDPVDYPPVVSSSNAGTISWCALISTTITTAGTIIGKVTLGGGDGLVHIANDSNGGGSGLTVAVGDNISVVSFGMKWDI